MKIKGLVWLDEIVEKVIQKHNVQPGEVKEVFDNGPQFRFVEKGHRPKENVYGAMGQTKSGRFLVIIFVYKKDGNGLILSARDMTPNERKRYEKK